MEMSSCGARGGHRRQIARIATEALHKLPSGDAIETLKDHQVRRVVRAFREIALDATLATNWDDYELELFAKNTEAIAASILLAADLKCGCVDNRQQKASCVQTCINEEADCRKKCEGDPDFIGCQSRCSLIAAFCALDCIFD